MPALMETVTSQADDLPMHRRRSATAQVAINANRAYTQGRTWGFNGTLSEYDLGSRKESLFATSVMERLRPQHRQLRILDIGAGAGKFVLARLAEGHQAIGLSLNDYRQYDVEDYAMAKTLPEDAYVVGDAHDLARLVGGGDFDFIVSNLAFRHFVDPLSVLEQAANRLAVGGVIAIDELPLSNALYANPTAASDAILVLRERGFEVDLSVHVVKPPVLGPLVATRTDHQPVRFGTTYSTRPWPGLNLV